MSGGNRNSHQGCCAPRFRAIAAVFAQFALLAFCLPTLAGEIVIVDQCEPRTPPEKSIVVISDDGAFDQLSTASDDDQPAPLEPIAKISEYEPDLAEPVVREPELANPPAAELAEEPASEQVANLREEESAQPEGINFQGVTPGISNRRDVFREWGDPRSETTTAPSLEYRFEHLEVVRVNFEGNLVDSIVVVLSEPMTRAELAEKLDLGALRPAKLFAKSGQPAGEAFPERGVELQFIEEPQAKLLDEELAIVADQAESSPKGPFVGTIVIQPIKSSAYIARAESTLDCQPELSMADLETALQLDPTSAKARVLMAAINLKQGKAITAERYLAEAVEIEPQQHAYRVAWARCLRSLARYDLAVAEARQVLESAGVEPIERAQSLYEMGMLASLGSKSVAKRSVPLFSKAIELADGLAQDEDYRLAKAAQELLVEAHLAVAVQIGTGDWDGKAEAVPRWIERASALAEGMISEDDYQLIWRLRVAVSALASIAGFEEPVDPMMWVEEAEQTSARLQENCSDPVARGEVQWQLGLAYFHAAQIQHRRSESESAERMGNLAVAQLCDLAAERIELPDTAYLMGRLYFQIGAVHAVHYENHEAACQWYDKAIDQLLTPSPVTTIATPQQHGDALVSMGVSYWYTNQQELAVEVTQLGVELIEQAVGSGLLESDSLAIPYNNLAQMYAARGDTEPAAKYTQLAKKISSEGEPSRK